MNASITMNALIAQCRRYYASSSMIVSAIANIATMQRRRCCTFDSPGLTSESEVYPGLFVVSGNNAVGVVPFIPQCFIAAFQTENVQHLRR